MRTLLFILLFCAFLLAAQSELKVSGMGGLTPAVRDHLNMVLKELNRTETGKFLKTRVSPEIRFETKPMKMLGQADGRNCITLEALRLEKDTRLPDKNSPDRTQICFTAAILAHELLHNAQFRAGLFSYPAGTTAREAVLFEKLLELQAKYMGENTYSLIRALPEYAAVRPKRGLHLVLQRQKPADLMKEFAETLWLNNGKTASGTHLYRTQIREVSQWNLAYAEQAFRNNYGRFLAEETYAETESAAFRTHLRKILDFTGLNIPVDFLLKNATVRPMEHGIVCYENGRKVMELIAVDGGILKRLYSGQVCRESRIRIGH